MLRRAAALLLVVLVPLASAFDSIPGGPHDDITKAAARNAGYPEAGIDALTEAVRAVDIRDNKLEPNAHKVGRIDATADYAPEHHCDRVPPAGDLDAFVATVEYIGQQRGVARNASAAGDAKGALASLGNALHAIEDCFSHSNAVDLDDPGAVVRAVNGNGSAPGGLWLTGFLPGAEDTERPPGDAYPHGDFAKDGADKNDEAKAVLPDGRTKFEAARDLAEEAATVFLRGWVGNATSQELAALAELKASDGSPLPQWDIPAAPLGVLALGIGLAAVGRRGPPG
ncbi:MAG: hypothetical protein QOC71_453 [Thermoplasmata archaeon]|jgi:hypothetical protein|nr:hypothetical protein [Thermoplasmata archaeon]